MTLTYTTPECLTYFKEFHPDNHQKLLDPTIDLICMTAAYNKVPIDKATTICINKTSDVEFKIRLQAAYALIISQKLMENKKLKQIQSDIERYKQHIIICEKSISADKNMLIEHYRTKIKELNQKENELIRNIDVKTEVVNPNTADKNTISKSQTKKGDG